MPAETLSRIVCLVAENRRSRLAVDEQDSFGQPRLKREIASVVKGELVAGTGLRQNRNEARLLDRHVEMHKRSRASGHGDLLYERTHAINREFDRHVARQEKAPR